MVTHSNVIFLDIINITFFLLFVKFQFHMSNVTKVMNLRRMMGQRRLGLSNDKFIHKRVVSLKSILTHHSSHGHNFSYFWHIGLKLSTHLNKSYRYHVSKYYIDILHHLQNIAIFYTILFFETPGTHIKEVNCIIWEDAVKWINLHFNYSICNTTVMHK